MLQHISIDTLIPYERNNKIHSKEQIAKIAKSIKELWFRAPILVDENFVILAGHGRLAAAKKLKLKEVPVIQYTDLTEEQKRKYRLLDNRLADLSEYDLENLRLELQELNDEWMNDLFSEFDLKLEEEEWEEEIEDEVPAIQDDPIVQEGDVFELEGKNGKHYLICGDSTKIETYTKLIELAGKKADLLFTDPPYNVNYKGQGKKTSNGILNDRMSDQNFLFFLQDTFHALKTALKQTAPLYVKFKSLFRHLTLFPVILLYLLITTSTYFGSSSMLMLSLPVFSAAIKVVPLPAKGSRTNSHSLLELRIARSTSSTGFCVGCS